MPNWAKWVIGIFAAIILLPAVPEIIKGLRDSLIAGVKGSTVTVNQVNPQGGQQVSGREVLPDGSFVDFQGQVWGRIKDQSPATPANAQTIVVDQHDHHYVVQGGGQAGWCGSCKCSHLPGQCQMWGSGQQVVQEQCAPSTPIYCEQPAAQWCSTGPTTARASATYANSFNSYVDRSRNAPFIDLSGLISLNVANGGYYGGGGGGGCAGGGYWDSYYMGGSSICGGGGYGGGYRVNYCPTPRPQPVPPQSRPCAPPMRYRSY